MQMKTCSNQPANNIKQLSIAYNQEKQISSKDIHLSNLFNNASTYAYQNGTACISWHPEIFTIQIKKKAISQMKK